MLPRYFLRFLRANPQCHRLPHRSEKRNNADGFYRNPLKDFLTSSHRTLLEALLKEVKEMEFKRDKDGIYQDPDGMGTPTNISYVEGWNGSLSDIASLLREALKYKEI